MACWKTLEEFGKQNSDIGLKINGIYGRRTGLTVEIRARCATWIESQPWLSLDPEASDFAAAAEQLFRGQCTQIQKLIDQATELFQQVQIQQFKDSFVEKFEGEHAEFVNVMKRCLQQEILLIQSAGSSDEALKRKEAPPNLAMENPEIMSGVSLISDKLRALEPFVAKLESEQEKMIIARTEIINKLHLLETEYSSAIDVVHKQNITANIQSLEQQQREWINKNFKMRDEICNKYTACALDLSKVMHSLWQDIAKWQKEQSMAITCLVKPKENATDILDRMCDVCTELLLSLLTQLDRFSDILNKQQYQKEAAPENMKALIDQLGGEYLTTHLTKVFVVDKNPPHQVIKVTTGKSCSFHMTARILGGRSLGLGSATAKVTVRLYDERTSLQQALAARSAGEMPKGECSITNGKDKVIDLNRATGRCSASFTNIVLEGCKRKGKDHNDDLVTEYIKAFVFYTELKIRDKVFFLTTKSLPVVLTSQTSQECMAKGTLIWSAAFALDPATINKHNKSLFAAREEVKWKDFACILNALFKEHTGRELEPNQLCYLARIAFREPTDQVDLDEKLIKKSQVMKDKLPKKEFQFWKWFWCCVNLVKDKIKAEWNENLVYGFISKEEAEAKLKNCPLGTFLVRFSESNIEAAQKAELCVHLTVAVVELHPDKGQQQVFHIKELLTPKDLEEKGLGRILEAYEVDEFSNTTTERPKKALLEYLWPNRKFYDAFEHHIREKEQKVNDGYKTGKFKIEIFLTESRPSRRNRNNSDAFSMAQSPGQASVMSESSYDQMSPISTVGTDTEDMNQLPPLPPPALPTAHISPLQSSHTAHKMMRTGTGTVHEALGMAHRTVYDQDFSAMEFLPSSTSVSFQQTATMSATLATLAPVDSLTYNQAMGGQILLPPEGGSTTIFNSGGSINSDILTEALANINDDMSEILISPLNSGSSSFPLNSGTSNFSMNSGNNQTLVREEDGDIMLT